MRRAIQVSVKQRVCVAANKLLTSTVYHLHLELMKETFKLCVINFSQVISRVNIRLKIKFLIPALSPSSEFI
jgi:hypothetical protein